MDMKIHPDIKQYLLPAIIRYSHINYKKYIVICSEFAYWVAANKINLGTIGPKHIQKKISEWKSEEIDAWEINNRLWILRKFFNLFRPDAIIVKGKHFLRKEKGCFNNAEIREIENALKNYPFVRVIYFFIKHYSLKFSKTMRLSNKDIDITKRIFRIDNKEFRFTYKLFEAIKNLSTIKKRQKETIFPSKNAMYRHIAQLSEELGFYVIYSRFYSNILLSCNCFNLGKNTSTLRYLILGLKTGLRPSEIRRIMQSMPYKKNAVKLKKI